MTTKTQRAARYAALPPEQKAMAVRSIASLIRSNITESWLEDYIATGIAARLLTEGSNPTTGAVARIRSEFTS